MNLSRRQTRESGCIALDVAFQRFTQRRLFPSAAQSPPWPVLVLCRGRITVLLHPRDQIGTGRESFATRKNRASSVWREPCQFLKERISVSVDIAEKREIKRISAGRDTIDANVVSRLVVHDEQSREVQRVELFERYQGVVRVHAPGCVIHGCE